MRLELRWTDVDELAAASATRLVGKRLEVDLQALGTLLATDARLTGIRLDLVHPGERCRIGRVFDVIAPRAKLDGGEDFPGVLGGVARAGDGRTLALAGVAVVATDQQTENVGTRFPEEAPALHQLWPSAPAYFNISHCRIKYLTL